MEEKESNSIKEKLKEIWYNKKKYIIVLACVIIVLLVVLIVTVSIKNKTPNKEKYKDIETIMLLNAQNYVKNNKIEKDRYIPLNNLNLKIDDELKCNTLSGVYFTKEKDNYYPYLICEGYKSNTIEKVIEENKRNKEYGELKGDNPLIVNESSYQEEGIESKYEVNIKGDDIENGLNIVTYYLNEKGKYVGEIKRIVIAEDIEGSYPVLTLYGNKTRTISRGSSYKESGYEAKDDYDGNITDKVKIEGEVDTNKVGTYKIRYSVTNTRNKTTVVERTVIVTESDINLEISHTIEPNTITKKSVTMKVVIKGNGYKYTMLPDNSKKEENEVTYTVYKNGTYDFIIYDTNDNSEVYSVKITNINTDPPKGTCVVTYENNSSTVKITPEEPTLIKQYEIYNDNKLLTTQKKTTYVFKDYPIEPKVKLVDILNKSRVIKCKINSKDVIYNDYGRGRWVSYRRNSSELKMYYNNPLGFLEYVPEKALNSKDHLPLIVWLHGKGNDDGLLYLENTPFLKEIKSWDSTGLRNIPAIIVAPNLDSDTTWWGYARAIETIKALVKYAESKYHIDTNRVVLMGFSLGGTGVIPVATSNQNLFSAVVIMSSTREPETVKEYADYFKTIPLKGYSEGSPVGDSMTRFFNYFGRSSDLKKYPLNRHGEIPGLALKEDSNNDKMSDLIFWSLSQRRR